MKCINCGRENGDDNNFCFYCGFSFRGTEPVKEINIAPDFTMREPARESGGSSMSTGKWCLYFMLLVFPYTWFIWLVLTFMWAFGSNGSQERKNMARGLLTGIAVVFVLAFIAAIILVATLGVDGAVEMITGGVATSADAYLKMMNE